MTIQEFIKKYDKKNAIILLEGKRKVLENDKEKLILLGKYLADNTKHATFRSGNAIGSDELFSKGVASSNNKKLQVITPYESHRKKSNLAKETISLDRINLAEEPDIIYYSKKNKKTKSLIDRYVDGKRDRYSIKAAYIIRDTVKVLGANGINPIVFGLFYDDLSNPMNGGTGHTMQVCIDNNVPILNQTEWFKWIDEIV